MYMNEMEEQPLGIFDVQVAAGVGASESSREIFCNMMLDMSRQSDNIEKLSESY